MVKRPLMFIVLCCMVLVSACNPIRPAAAPASPGGTVPAGGPLGAANGEMAALVEQANQWQLTDALPMDPNIRVGQLANGLKYVIRRNTEPANRAELRLAINAGSVLEDNDQKGLAHLLEHMMFNGTERFPKQALIDFMEGVGMKFGPHVNAYTSFDETVYMLQVPTDKPEVLGKGFDILEDWAGHATLDAAEIDKERGVVVEEWRERDKGAEGRITNQWYPFVLSGSQYAERLPIGDVEIIKNAPAETVRRFYDTWYRPDLMTVVAVGDFDVNQVEGWIKERMGRLTNKANAAARPTIEVPNSPQDRILVIADPEYPYAFVDLTFHQPAQPQVTVGDLRTQLLTDLANQMLNARYDELARQKDAPFVNAVAYQNDLVRTVQENGVQAQVDESKILTGTQALVTELERVRRFGFTDTELERAKQELLRSYEKQYAEREKSESANYADGYVQARLTQSATPGIANRYALVQRFLPEIKLAEVNEKATALLQNNSRYLLVVAPKKPDLNLPTEQALGAVLTQVQNQTLTPYVDKVANAKLMTSIPTPSAIVSETTDAKLGTTTIKLANGVQVVMKPTDFKADEVLVNAVSLGGSSLVSDADFPEAAHISEIVDNSGVGDFDRNALTRLLAGKVVSVSPYINELNEGLRGSASTKDLETLFQLIYLYVTKPRADESAFATFKDQMHTALENRSLSVDAAFSDAITQARFGNSVRYNPLTLAEIDQFDLQRAMAIYHERFADAGDFTFVFVGNFDVATLKTLAQTYLGNLPSANQHETWQDVKPNPPEGQIAKMVYKGEDEQSRSFLLFTGYITPTQRNSLVLNLLQDVLDIRLRNDLREERGGTYSPGVYGNIAEDPDKSYGFYVTFGSDPKRVDELIKATWGDIADVKRAGPHADEFAKVTEQARRTHENDLRENQYWLGVLVDDALHPAKNAEEVLSFNEALDSIKPADIQSAAQQYLPEDRYIKVIQLPAAYQPK